MDLTQPGADEPVRVALSAAYPAVRAGLRALLAEDDLIFVATEAGSLRDLAIEHTTDIDVIMVDLDLGGAWGAPEDALPFPPEVGFVLLGPAAGEAGLIESLGDRAWAYLLQDAGSAELALAVHGVAGGLVVVQPPLIRRLLAPAELPGLIAREDRTLTARELEVLQLVAQGLPNKTIARRLGISEHTVKFHITSILTKLEATSRTDAVRLGARRGLIAL